MTEKTDQTTKLKKVKLSSLNYSIVVKDITP